MSPGPIMDRHVALYRRQMPDQILVSFTAAKRPGEIGDYLPVVPKGANQEWTERPCRSEADMPGVMEEVRRENQAFARLPDDSVPSPYPTVRFGESILAAMLGTSIGWWGRGSLHCALSCS